ncbi:MAG: lysylphosphatidylglycerol synthase transmembrane domain-containing protein, partial [Candidatus Aminicenantia bacterium]
LISEGLSSIVIERIFDLAGLVVVGGAMFYFLPDDASIPKEFASFILLVLGFIAFSILLLLLLNYRYDALIFPVRKFVSVVFWFSKGIKDRILENLTLAINAMLSICKSKYMVPIFLLSIITWLSPCFMYLYFFRAFNINFHWSVIFLGSVLVTLTFLIPSAPGYLGTFEAAWVFVYLGLGIAVEKALPVGLAVHFTTLFFIIVLGYIGLVIYGIGRRDVFGMISERI